MLPFRRSIVGPFAAVLTVSWASACRESGGPDRMPANVVPAALVRVAEVGTALTAPPTFVVRDASGEPIAGVAVSVAVGEGGGTLRNAPTRTLPGATPVGQWTLGTSSGRNTLVISVGRLPPLILEVTATAGSPTAIRVAIGADQLALAGDALATPIGVLVVDRYGNPVPDQVVNFEAITGGGTVAPSMATTGRDGVAGGVRWRLGARTSMQTVRAAVAAIAVAIGARVRSDFVIELRFPGVAPSPEFQSAFLRAADRIRTAVVGDVPDVAVQSLNVSSCGGGAIAPLTETIDDVVIFASVVPIDGVGKVLARAGPCFVRNTTLQSLVGTMQFDDADAQNLLDTGRFEAVVMHEMLHIVGIGSLWRLKSLVDSIGTQDPRYVGALGISRCALIGFGAQCITGVPVENTGGSGTAGVHWRESTFDRELMTGFAESTPDRPFSLLTIGALADYGYEVNEKGSDPFAFSTLLAGWRARSRDTALPEAPWEEVLVPRFEVSPFGFVQPMRVAPFPATK